MTQTPTQLDTETEMLGSGPTLVPTGITPLDERIGGLQLGGSYLVVGSPGPAKMVTALQFLHTGLAQGESGILVTAGDPAGILAAAQGWGLDLAEPWEDGRLKVLSFRDDFELRAARSVVPEEVLEELDRETGRLASRVVIDPGTLFLTGGGRTLLGGAFLRWARTHPATVLATYSVDTVSQFPTAAEWLLQATTGRLVVEPRSGGLHQVTLESAFGPDLDTPESVSLQLQPGRGLVRPDAFPSRRGGDRGGVDPSRVLVLSLASEQDELRAWVTGSFSADVLTDPMVAMSRIQEDRSYGAVLIFSPRRRIRDALNSARAIRPLTAAALVFASDDQVRASDRIALLEAGTDDCMSGGVDFRELDLRLRQAIASGARALPVGERRIRAAAPSISGGAVDGTEFLAEAERRAAEPANSVFCLLHVRASHEAADQLSAALTEEIRADAGDLLTRQGDGILVLLQGARGNQAEPFLERVRARLVRDGTPGLSLPTPVLHSHPADASGIWNALGELRAAGD